MKLEYKRKLVDILRVCQEYTNKNKSKKWLKERLRDAIEPLSSFNMREKADLYRTAFETATEIRTGTAKVHVGAGGKLERQKVDFSVEENCKKIVQKMGSLERHTGSREKIQQTKQEVARARDDKLIFYACSKHSAPAKDHKDYQGKIYVDRYWRQILRRGSGTGFNTGTDIGWLEAAVEDYIQNHQIMTLQQVMKGPVWLGTRPYCKHFFVPVKTLTVLTRDPEDLAPVTYSKKTKRGATYEYIKKHLAKS